MSEAEAERPVVLAVDDSTDILALVKKALASEYFVLTASDAGSALELAAARPRPSLILLDIDMPGASGFDVCRVLKSEANTADIPVVFLTAREDPAAQVEGLELGAVDYVTKPLSAAVLRARVRNHVALANQHAELGRMVVERTRALEETRLQLIRRLSRAMEMHESSAVGNRVVRLAQYARILSEAAGAKPAMAEMMMTAAPLHDIGKLGVPADLLRKTGKLSAPDWERVRRHPELGAEIIGEHDDPLLKVARQMALYHHERWDGTGYPEGLKGADIPWPGRLMAIVDSFESMTTTQFYREPLNVLEAAAEIQEGSGTRFDPKLVEAFKRALPQMKKVLETYSDSLGDLIDLDFSPGRGTGKKAQKAAAVKRK
ncbi:MAG: response regulator [Betaproteobacteria bacterium]|nr:response regulator [Betaproteobacteria bacterium]